MNCTDIHTHIDDYLDLALSELESKQFDDHIQNCSDCQNTLQQAQSLQYELQNMPVEKTDKDFEQRILNKVHAQNKQSDKPFMAGFATAIAASLAIWFAVSLFQPNLSEQNSTAISLTLNTTRTVNLKFDAPEALQQVSMSIELPDHVEISNYPGRKSLNWTTQFTKGSNILSLPIKAISNGNGELIAHIKYGDKSKRFRIILNTHLNGVWQLKPEHPPAA
jgi:Putative zinc-finger